jgi:DNA end-binding protein Ku
VPRRSRKPPRSDRNESARDDRTEDVPAADDARTTRGIWSGNLSFGLVSLPVSLVTAQRSARVPFRMLAPDGTPLKRRYFSGANGAAKGDDALEADDIVRGYEVEKGKYVIVEDAELDALAPKLSQEIDLKRFVPLDDIDPMYFERGYYLLPGNGAVKAYRLLAHVMEERGRAGIATFVMRGKEYLVAIVARGGILRAETLRFADELRDPADIGIDGAKADAEDVRAFEKQIAKLEADALREEDLEDRQLKRLTALIERKRRAREDVVELPEAESQEEPNADVIDLMQYLKRSLAGEEDRAASRERKRPRAAAKKDKAPAKKKPARRRSRKAQ